jgi:phosphohistidine phosphatase SixA
MEGIRMSLIIRPMLTLVALALLSMPAIIISCAGSSAHRITSPSGTTTTYILVRHAEKESNDVASPLTEKGRARARALIDAVVPLGVTAIYCTQTRRNMETVEPLSEHLGIEVQTLYKGGPMNAGYLADHFIQDSLARHSGGVILWVGNTSALGDWADNLHQIYLRLGGTGQGPRAYDDLFIMIVDDKGRVDIQRRHYGDPVL